MRRVILMICLTFLLDACQQPTDAEIQLHASTMERMTKYHEIKQEKVMAACIEWETSSKHWLNVKGTYTYYEDPGTDYDIPGYKLMRQAILWCNQERQTLSLKCVCEPLDRDGRTALKIPKSLLSN